MTIICKKYLSKLKFWICYKNLLYQTIVNFDSFYYQVRATTIGLCSLSFILFPIITPIWQFCFPLERHMIFIPCLQFLYSPEAKETMSSTSLFSSSDTSFRILLNTSSGLTLTWAIFYYFCLRHLYVCKKKSTCRFVRYHKIITILYTGRIFTF